MLSTRLAATSSPLPVRSRRTSAAQTPIAAYEPAMRSDSGGAARAGASSSRAVHAHEPAHRLRDEVERRAVAVGPVQPEAR